MDKAKKRTDEAESCEERINRRHPVKVSIITAIITGIITTTISAVVTAYIQGDQIVGEIARRFDFVDEKGSLNDALESLYAELDAREDQIQKLQSEDAGQRAIALAQDKWNAGEYAEALSILSEAADESSEAYALYVDYASQYANIVLSEVDELTSEKDFDGASSLLDEAIDAIGDSERISELEERRQEVEDERPVDMLDVVAAYQFGGNTYTEYSSKKSGTADSFSMGGVKYTDGMTFSADINVFNEVSWAIYNLSGNYRDLEFVVSHVDGTDNGDPTTLQVFYDGELKEEIALAPDMLPKTVTLDLTDVGQLKLQVPASGAADPLYGIGNPKITPA